MTMTFRNPILSGCYPDASIHLPALYELWALWPDKNNPFWEDAAGSSWFSS
jgi:hypothetical protein